MNIHHGFVVSRQIHQIFFLVVKKNKNYYDINNLNIGGDDMKLIQYDLRCGEGNNKIAQINKKLKKNISK